MIGEFHNIMKHWQLFHVGIVVRDLDKAVAFWESTGMATFDDNRFH